MESTNPVNKTELKTAYKYNIRSWTNAISNSNFSEQLSYKHNGDIETVNWEQNSKNRSYAFEYDQLSRLTKAVYKGTTNEDFSTSYIYDAHGNIQLLTRNGVANNKPILMDNLEFKYIGNQMKSVENRANPVMASSSVNVKDNIHQDIEFLYNDNGAMKQDLNKGVQDIAYNFLNLPKELFIDNDNVKAKNTYLYTAAGSKLKVVHESSPKQQLQPLTGLQLGNSEYEQIYTTDYIGNLIYEEGELKRILLSNGYYDNEDKKFYFYITDHLGNNRIVADASGQVVQNNQYYPFGMEFTENSTAEQSIQPYKYNGKELDEKAGLNQYDYSARFYDPGYIQLPTRDPHSEKYYSWSPYVYVGNNPMRLTDPTGMDWVMRTFDGLQEVYYDRNVRSQDDVNIKYGSDGGVTHISNGKAYSTYDKNGNELDRYQFWNDASENNAYGAITDAKGNLYADDQIISGNTYTIFGTTDNNVDASTLYSNMNGFSCLFGGKGFFGNNSYTGGHNPLTYSGDYSYEFMPKNMSEYPPMGHDKDYDVLGLAGSQGVFGSTLGWKADLRLAANSSAVTTLNILTGNLSDAKRSAAISVAFGAIGTVKTILHPITIGVNNFNRQREKAALNNIQVSMPYAPF